MCRTGEGILHSYLELTGNQICAEPLSKWFFSNTKTSEITIMSKMTGKDLYCRNA